MSNIYETGQNRLYERIEELEEATFDYQFLKRSHAELLAAAKHFQECLMVNGCSLCDLADKAIAKAESK